MNLTDKLVYLDREFVSNLYEDEFGYSPETKITKTEGMRASAIIPLFSAGASSVESKSYSKSTVEMCKSLTARLKGYKNFSDCNHDFGHSSSICWVDGILTINKVEVKRRTHEISVFGEPDGPCLDNKERFVAEEFYFAVHSEAGEFALLPTEDYFASGVAAFKGLARTVVGPIELPVSVLIRVFSAQTSFKQWMSVPLIIVEP